MCRGSWFSEFGKFPWIHTRCPNRVLLYPFFRARACTLCFREAMEDIQRFCKRNQAVKLSSKGGTCNFLPHLIVKRWRPVLGLKLQRSVRRPKWMNILGNESASSPPWPHGRWSLIKKPGTQTQGNVDLLHVSQGLWVTKPKLERRYRRIQFHTPTETQPVGILDYRCHKPIWTMY